MNPLRFRAMVPTFAVALLHVVTAIAAPPAQKPDPAAALLTAENYEQIKVGMSKEDVQAILGRPNSGMGNSTTWTSTWRLRGDTAHKIEVHYREGAVTSKSTNFDWSAPVKPAATKPAAVAATKPAVPDPIDAALAKLRPPHPAKGLFDRERALGKLANADYDEARAGKVASVAMIYLDDKDFALRTSAEQVLRKWATLAQAEHFRRIVAKKVDARNAVDRPEHLDLAIDILVRLRDPEGVKPIAHLLTRFFDRKDAIAALEQLGPELAEAEVLKYANDKDANTGAAAKEVLAFFKTKPAARLPQYLNDLKSSSPDRRLWAAQEIEKLDVDPARRKEIADALEAMLPDKNAWPAHAACKALIKWGAADNEPALIKALSHASPDIHRLAANALEAFGTTQSLPALEKVAGSSASAEESAAPAAKRAIDAIRKRGK